MLRLLKFGDQHMALIWVAHSVMEQAQFLSDQVHSMAFLHGEGPAERQFIPHPVVLEQKDARVYFERAGIVQVQRRIVLASGVKRGAAGFEWRLVPFLVCAPGRSRRVPVHSKAGRRGPLRHGRQAAQVHRAFLLSAVLVDMRSAVHAFDRLFFFDALFFTCLQHFFVFDAEFAAANVEPIERIDDLTCLGR